MLVRMCFLGVTVRVFVFDVLMLILSIIVMVGIGLVELGLF